MRVLAFDGLGVAKVWLSTRVKREPMEDTEDGQRGRDT
jgi:hypothetical protein